MIESKQQTTRVNLNARTLILAVLVIGILVVVFLVSNMIPTVVWIPLSLVAVGAFAMFLKLRSWILATVVLIGCGVIATNVWTRKNRNEQTPLLKELSAENPYDFTEIDIPAEPSQSLIESSTTVDAKKIVLVKLHLKPIQDFPSALRSTVTQFSMAFLLHAVNNDDGFSIDRITATPFANGEGGDRAFQSTSQSDQRALGVFGTMILKQWESDLKLLRVIARSKNLWVFDSPNRIFENGNYKPKTRRHFCFLNSVTGRVLFAFVDFGNESRSEHLHMIKVGLEDRIPVVFNANVIASPVGVFMSRRPINNAIEIPFNSPNLFQKNLRSRPIRKIEEFLKKESSRMQ